MFQNIKKDKLEEKREKDSYLFTVAGNKKKKN